MDSDGVTPHAANSEFAPFTMARVKADPLGAVEHAMTMLGARANAAQAVLIFIVALAARAGERLWLRLIGPSSTATAFLAKQVLSLVPPVDVVPAQHLTVPYLTRQNKLNGTCFYADETLRSGALRAVIRRLVRDGEDHRYPVRAGEPVRLRIKGPISLVEVGLDSVCHNTHDASCAITLAIDAGCDAVTESIQGLVRVHSLEGRSVRGQIVRLRRRLRSFCESLDPTLYCEIPRELLEAVMAVLKVQ